MRNRIRWVRRGGSTDQMRDDARAFVCRLLGIADLDSAQPVLRKMATADIIEVSIPFVEESVGWAYRILPWEYLLSGATESLRDRRTLLVLRHLRQDKSPRRQSTSSKLFLHIEAAPPELEESYDFTSEAQLIQATSKFFDLNRAELVNPTEEKIEQTVAHLDPVAIHISGFDSWLAAAELRDRNIIARSDQDGLLLPTAVPGGWGIVDAKVLAARLVPITAAPRLVAFSLFNSGARMAAMCVAEGADAAVGFQDTFDARLGELFFAAFYRACAVTEWDYAGALRYAWDVVSRSGRPLIGSGVIVWIAKSLRDHHKVIPLAQLQRRIERKAEEDEPGDEDARDKVIARGLEFEITPKTSINYSMVHNRGALFDCFIIRKGADLVGAIGDIEVEVRLQVGADTYPFQTNLSLTVHEFATELADEIFVSLTSDMARSVRDTLQTTLFITVTRKATILHRKTHRVLLLPVDQWRDDDANRRWLASFVLPRDLAVRQVIDSAQKYLRAPEDDPGAGFDGYQGAADSPEDPVVDCETVDQQVRAIWSALLYDHPLAYINPPPTFTNQSQRLRTPSDVLAGRRGTCIDLALLLAACLEYCDIHPAIILLEAHAFPAYWRHPSYLEAFRSESSVDITGQSEGIDPDLLAALLDQQASWSLGKAYLPAILDAVQAGHLVPLESVWLTQNRGYAEAVEEGLANLMRPDQFDSMIDIQLARSDPYRAVTPLPIRREEP